jgi:hypothetical protein
MKISDEYNTWLKITPQTVKMSPLEIYLDKMKTTVSIDLFSETFVGTLDSFSQKLLREFAFESGKIERAEITEDAKSYTRQLIHDVLREWIQSQPQQVIDFLYISGQLKSVDHYIQLVESSLNFSSAHLKQVDLPVFSTVEFESCLHQFAASSSQYLQELQDYYILDGAYYKFINKKAFAKDRFHFIFQTGLVRLAQQIQKQGSDNCIAGMGIACEITTWASTGSHQHANTQSDVINRRFSARFILTIAVQFTN